VKSIQVTDLPLQGLKLVQRSIVGDRRGYLSRLFCADQLAATGWSKPIAQLNHTYTARRGTIRGMHFQRPPYAEIKLVSCIAGEIFDVAVDLRPGSQTYLKHHVEHLSADNRKAMMIPEGFAHGFQSLTDDVQLIYCHSAIYNAQAESGLNPQDPALGIPWPLPISEISARDSQHAFLSTSFSGVIL